MKNIQQREICSVRCSQNMNFLQCPVFFNRLASYLSKVRCLCTQELTKVIHYWCVFSLWCSGFLNMAPVHTFYFYPDRNIFPSIHINSWKEGCHWNDNPCWAFLRVFDKFPRPPSAGGDSGFPHLLDSCFHEQNPGTYLTAANKTQCSFMGGAVKARVATPLIYAAITASATTCFQSRWFS